MSQTNNSQTTVSPQKQKTKIISMPNAEDFSLSDREKQLLKDLIDWEKQSSKTHWILGQPVGR